MKRIDRVTALCVALGVALVGTAGALAARGPMPSLATVVVFGVLLALAENQIAEMPARVMVSAGFMVAMAAIVALQGPALPLGALLVGAFGCLHLPHLRARDWRKLLFNAATLGFSTLAAALAFGVLVPGTGEISAIRLLLASLPAALAFGVVDTALVAAVLYLANGQSPRDALRQLLPSAVQLLPFALLGVFMGQLYVDFGAIMVPLFVVPILVARQAFGAYLALKESHEATVRILVGALEAKDPYTAGHAERVAGYAQYIGMELGLSPTRLERLRLAALMHDVGKLVVPNHLLNKPGKLTAAEFEQVRRHEAVSVEILTRIDFLAPVAPSATSEAAAFSPVADDRGQPIEPHIVAVADAFDAMTSTRSYRRALSQEVAFAELRANSGKQFHPRVVHALITALERREEHHGAGFEAEPHEFEVEPPAAGTGSAGLGDLLPDAAEHGAATA